MKQFTIILLLILSILLFAKNYSPITGFGSVMKFDDWNDYVNNIGYNNPTNDFTIEFWLKPNELLVEHKGFGGYCADDNIARTPSMWQYGEMSVFDSDSEIDIKLIDITERSIYANNFDKNSDIFQPRINLDEYSTGIYYLLINSENIRIKKKIIVSNM